MYFLLLLPAFLIAGIGIAVRKRSQSAGNALILLGCLGCLGVLTWQVRESLFTEEPQIPPPDAIALNAGLTGFVQQELKGKPGAVLLLFADEKSFPDQNLEDFRDSFRGPLLRGHPELKVETARLKPQAGAADFKAALSAVPGVISVVSYAGAPADIGQAFPAGSPPLFVFDAKSTTNWLSALKSGAIRGVVVPRPGVDPTQVGVGMPLEMFSKLYLLVTTGNADQIAAQLSR